MVYGEVKEFYGEKLSVALIQKCFTYKVQREGW